VRSPRWQRDFLARPLAERRAIAQGLRAQSKDFQRTLPSYIDPDPAATVQWLSDAGSTTLIHGHTHRPREHALDGGCRRIVLSDWDLRATPPRAEVLRLTREPRGEVAIRRIAPEQA
jgi:UDP-2,3-diacylglucosamine hydrolase